MAFSQIVLVCLLAFRATVGDRFAVHKDHLQEELNHMMPDEKFELNDDEQMEFHYFKIHDHNNDNRLDGLELGAAMTHYHEGDEDGQETRKQVDISDEELENLIEQILKDDDLNDDGYVDYYEFVHAQKKMRSNTNL